MLTLGGWGEFDRWVGSLAGVGHHSLLFRAQQCSVFHRYDIINGFSLSEECKMLFLESFGWGTWGSCLPVSSSLLGCLICPSRCISSRRERLFMSWFWFHHSFLQSTFFSEVSIPIVPFLLTIFTKYPFQSALAIGIDSAWDIVAQYFLVLC